MHAMDDKWGVITEKYTLDAVVLECTKFQSTFNITYVVSTADYQGIKNN